MKLQSTSNYEIFEMMDFNRDVKRTKALEESMKEHGYISAYPLHVVPGDNGKLKVKGGHHRLTVAAKLGIPVYYVVCSDTVSVHKLEKATIKWSMEDYLTSFSRLGDPDYLKVKEYHERTGIPLQMCISMLGGESAANGNFGNRFKSGEYRVRSTQHADDVACMVSIMKSVGLPWATESMSVSSISRVIIAGHVDFKRLIKKVRQNFQLMMKQPSVNAYLNQWEEIYNRNERGTRVPVAFLTDETMRERQRVWKRSQKPA